MNITLSVGANDYFIVLFIGTIIQPSDCFNILYTNNVASPEMVTVS